LFIGAYFSVFLLMLVLYTYNLVSDDEFLVFYHKMKTELPPSLLQKIEAFKFLADQQRSLMGQLIVRWFYAQRLAVPWQDIEFEYNHHEKPQLKNYPHHFFNISHSGNMVVVAFSDGEVGVDVEKIKGDRRKIAQRFFTPSEIEDMMSYEAEQQQLYFYQLWTLKESYMKAIGSGISMSLDSFAFTKDDNGFKLTFSKNDTEWFFYSTNISKDYFLSICSKEAFLNDNNEIDIIGIENHLVLRR